MRLAPAWSIRREVMRRALRRPPVSATMRKWHWWADHHSGVFFVQIGSNDGRAGDPLQSHIDQHGWHGLMVEPIPTTFARLVEHRGETPGVELVNAAITDYDGTAPITVVESVDPWASQLASLHSDVAASHRAWLDDLATHTIDVPCMTFDSLVATVERIDVLHIDAEGHDAVILAQVDLNRWQPSVILYENEHLSAGDRGAVEARLASDGYRLTSSNTDTLALRSGS